MLSLWMRAPKFKVRLAGESHGENGRYYVRPSDAKDAEFGNTKAQVRTQKIKQPLAPRQLCPMTPFQEGCEKKCQYKYHENENGTRRGDDHALPNSTVEGLWG